MNKIELKKQIIKSLKHQGFLVKNGHICLPENVDKATLREMHALAIQHRKDKFREGLFKYEKKLLMHIAAGEQVIPEKINPRLVEVKPKTEEELLFRYASLHWSIPVSSGYGRRLRFLVFDDYNQKLIGLFGLGDPVFSLAARDKWIGWDHETRKEKLSHIMDAFVLGSVPPYSFLLCGKLIAMLISSAEVRQAFRRKYVKQDSLILEKPFDGRLALITTTSALGRSSIYNRLSYNKRSLFQSVGYTSGFGEFHFSNGLYGSISQYATKYCEPSAKQKRWGTGFRNKREVVDKCLAKIGLSKKWLQHGIHREIFVVPLAQNAPQFLRGEHERLYWNNQSCKELFAFFKKRWLLPRSYRDHRYKLWRPDEWVLWSGGENV